MKFIEWFYYKEKPYCRLRFGNLVTDSLYSIILLLIILIINKNLSDLNSYIIWFVKLGSLGLCVVLFFFLKYISHILVNLKYGLKGLANGYKLILMILVILILFNVYNNQNKYINAFNKYYTHINISKLNPLIELDSTLNLVGDTIYDTTTSLDKTIKTKPLSDIFYDTTTALDKVIKTEPISEKTKEVEQAILKYTNIERKNNNLAALTWDDRLADIARAHSLDMVNNNFFSHTNLNGEDPSDRAKRSNYNARKNLGGGVYSIGIAENIGKMPTGNVIGMGYVSSSGDSIGKAHVQSWMESPGHRANILDPEYDRIGVGIAYDGLYYVGTQNFR